MLDPIVAREIAGLYPEGLDGLRVLHLQCHFGSDTLSLAQLGASVVGIDFSRPAVQEARRMAAELDLPTSACFIEANIYDARHILPEPESFDLVFTMWGTIGWLPDVAEWARIIAWFLKPGGVLYFADGHPAAFVFDGDGGPGRMPEFTFPYASTEPDVLDDPGDYADPDAVLEYGRTWEWCIRSRRCTRLSVTPASPSTRCASTSRCRSPCSRCWWETTRGCGRGRTARGCRCRTRWSRADPASEPTSRFGCTGAP